MSVPNGEVPMLRALVDRAVAGDRAAFADLYDLHLRTVYRFVLHRVGQPELAEDLTSETFARALRRIGTFTWQGREFAAWLITIARNLIVDHFKSSRVRLEAHVSPDLMAEVDSDLLEDVEATVLAGLDFDHIRALVTRLCPGQRAVIQARYLDQLSVSETAARLGKHEGAVKTTQWRAVQRLRALLTPQEVAS